MDFFEPPPREELLLLLERVRPRAEALFRRHGVAGEEARKILQEALLALLHQWDRVASPDWWLLDRIRKAAAKHRDPAQEEAEHGEETD